MPEFLTLLPPEQALDVFLSKLETEPKSRKLNTKFASGRVTYSAVISSHPLPEFPRTTVDGYAVRAADTYGASESLPAYLNIIDEVPMGSKPGFSLAKSECAVIHTGGMVPEGADAVVMVEHTQHSRSAEVEVLRAVAVGDRSHPP